MIKFALQGLIVLIILPLLLLFGSTTHLFIGFTTLWSIIFLIVVHNLLR